MTKHHVDDYMNIAQQLDQRYPLIDCEGYSQTVYEIVNDALTEASWQIPIELLDPAKKGDDSVGAHMSIDSDGTLTIDYEPDTTPLSDDRLHEIYTALLSNIDLYEADWEILTQLDNIEEKLGSPDELISEWFTETVTVFGHEYDEIDILSHVDPIMYRQVRNNEIDSWLESELGNIDGSGAPWLDTQDVLDLFAQNDPVVRQVMDVAQEYVQQSQQWLNQARDQNNALNHNSPYMRLATPVGELRAYVRQLSAHSLTHEQARAEAWRDIENLFTQIKTTAQDTKLVPEKSHKPVRRR